MVPLIKKKIVAITVLVCLLLVCIGLAVHSSYILLGILAFFGIIPLFLWILDPGKGSNEELSQTAENLQSLHEGGQDYYVPFQSSEKIDIPVLGKNGFTIQETGGCDPYGDRFGS